MHLSYTNGRIFYTKRTRKPLSLAFERKYVFIYSMPARPWVRAHQPPRQGSVAHGIQQVAPEVANCGGKAQNFGAFGEKLVANLARYRRKAYLCTRFQGKTTRKGARVVEEARLESV